MIAAYNIKKILLITIMVLFPAVSTYEYSRSVSAGSKTNSSGKHTAKLNVDTSKSSPADTKKSDSATGRSIEAPSDNRNTLIEGMVVNKEIRSSETGSDKSENYYLYLRDTDGRLRKFETTEFNYNSVKYGDKIFYKYTSNKKYKLVIFPPRV